MLELMGEDSIVFQDQVGLFKIMTSLEMPKVQKELIWGVPDRVVAQVYPYLILLQHTRQGLNKEEWEQKKKRSEMRVKLKEIRKLMEKESERLELPLELEQSPEAYDRIKSKLIDDEVIHLTPWPSILPPQWNLDEQFLHT